MPQPPEKSPKFADEQDAPEPERPVTPLEEAGQDIASLDDPPQAEVLDKPNSVLRHRVER